MNDLLVFLRALLIQDAVLNGLWLDNGLATGVSVLAPTQRVGAAYPRLIITERGSGNQQSGDGWAQFWRGLLELEIVAKKSDACPYPKTFVEAVYARLLDLVLGNPRLSLPPMQGQQVSGTAGQSGWHCDVFAEASRAFLPTADDTVVRLMVTYRAMVNRSGL